MEIDRRHTLALLAGSIVGALFSNPCYSAAVSRNQKLYLSARAVASGGYRVAGFSANGVPTFDLPLPGRAHAFAVSPTSDSAVLFSRRPGRFALVLDINYGRTNQQVTTLANRHFYGHGVFSPDGQTMYATENDFEGERGVIGVYDVGCDYRRIGEYPSYGIGPHEIVLLPDGETLAVANGGIVTHPDIPRMKLNLPTMSPSLCYIDRHEGRLLQKLTLEPALRQLSIRHLAVNSDSVVAIVFQYEGPINELVPLIALHRMNDRLELIQAPLKVLQSMRNYCGSVCFDISGETFAVSSPRGSVITFWHTKSGQYLSSVKISDGCGIAPGTQPNEFIASGGLGDLVTVDAFLGEPNSLALNALTTSHWDNHLGVVAIE